MSIRSFRHKGLKRLFEDDDLRGVPAGQARKLADVLAALDTAEEPGGNWRVVFRFEKGDASDVDLTDYH